MLQRQEYIVAGAVSSWSLWAEFAYSQILNKYASF